MAVKGISVFKLIENENLFDLFIKSPGNIIGQFQGRIVFSLF